MGGTVPQRLLRLRGPRPAGRGPIGTVALAVLGVACNMAAYFFIAAMIRLLLSGCGLGECLPWCGALLVSYVGKSVLSAWSTAMSHTATYYTLRDLRKSLLSKLSRVPMGTILDTPSGQYGPGGGYGAYPGPPDPRDDL